MSLRSCVNHVMLEYFPWPLQFVTEGAGPLLCCVLTSNSQRVALASRMRILKKSHTRSCETVSDRLVLGFR